MGALGSWLVGLAAPAVRNVLLSLGIGMVSYAALSSAVSTLLSQAKNYFNGLPSHLAGLVGLMGGGEILSILAGAMVARTALAAVKKFGVL